MNKVLNPGPSDPDVPLPQADLADGAGRAAGRMAAASDFRPQEEGGGVFGLRSPFRPIAALPAGDQDLVPAGRPELGPETRR